MALDQLPLADIVANDPETDVLEDQRAQHGYVLVRCPNDDGTDDHALHVCNPREGLPAMMYCLSPSCRDVTTRDFIDRLGLSPPGATRH